MGKKLVKNYFFTPGPGYKTYLYPNALTLLEANKEFIQREIIGYIDNRVAAADPDFVGYIYDTDLCLRDSGYVIDAWIFDLKYGGNFATRKVAAKYWNKNVPTIDGTRVPEIKGYEFAENLINNFILKNILSTPYQSAVDQFINLSKISESDADDLITNVATIVRTVIQNGLGSLPSISGGPGRIELLGKLLSNEILLITNTTDNIIIYNFSDSVLGGTIDFIADNTINFPNATSINNGVTTLYLNYSTNSMSSTDNLQIFVESQEVKVRPYDFGTDAIERLRVAQPQAMIDADFEYGLQPTKWQAIAGARGYPTTYEVLGTDILVANNGITTNASSGTNGVGASLITVKTVSAHGLVIGDPFTIRALNSSVNGFNRAEGTFLVNTVSASDTFTFYAKAKVGVGDGEIIGSASVQLRKAAFYTGAEVSTPILSVASNGSAGTFSTQFIVPSNSAVINFTGTVPSLGAPLSHPSIPNGSQVAGIFGDGGKVGDFRLKSSTISTESTIYFADLAGLNANMVINNSGTQNPITILNGEQAVLSDPIGANLRGDQESYFVTPTSVIGIGTGARFNIQIGAGGAYNLGATNVPTGTGARFTITSNGSTYTINAITAGGSGYTANDTVKVLGSLLGGVNGTNDCRIIVNTVAAGVVTAVTVSPYNQAITSATYSNLASVGVTGSSTLPAIQAAGIGYQQGDTLLVAGTSLGGTLDDNLYLNVVSVNNGAVTDVSISKGAHTTLTEEIYQNLASSNAAAQGTNLLLTVTRNAGTYSAIPYAPGQGFNVGNRFKILGTDVGGTTTANDLILYVDSTTNFLPGGSYGQGGVYGLTVTSGTAVRGDTIAVYSALSITNATSNSMPVASSVSFSAIATLQATFPNNHGLVPGANILVSISSNGSNHTLAAGPFAVTGMPSSNTILYIARSSGTIATGLSGAIYARPDAFFTHRPFDGGVQLSSGGPQHGAQAIRQSKKYIRYQSGKGAMYNTGALFAPSFDIRSATASGTTAGSTITIVTDDVDHGMQAGASVILEGIETIGYDGEYIVTGIIDERVFTVEADLPLGSTTGSIGSPCFASLKYWSGAVVRSGVFDDQNGIFWQYNGREMAVGRRSSTFQLSGTVSANTNSNLITGFNSRFRDQLSAGDRIILRGMSHIVTHIDSDTQMTLNPDYRGVSNVTGAKIAKIIDIIIPQSQWNIDTCDGNGPSGYNIDVTKMQMIGIQFSWYGAGFIDWMLRGPTGDYIFCHRLKGNNLNNEAYMRTGNLPVRYEVLNEGVNGRLAANMDLLSTSITLNDASQFPNSGTVYIDNELINYGSKTGNVLNNITRSAIYTNFASGSTRSYTAGARASHTAKTGVILTTCTANPIISHWGSAYLIDGNFDQDRGFIFNYQAAEFALTNFKQTVFLIRLAPSVSNSVIGDLGERELINRAQLLLQGIEITGGAPSSTGSMILEGVLNPQNYPTDPNNITWRSLNSSALGGQPSFAQAATGGSVVWTTGTNTITAPTTRFDRFRGNIDLYFSTTSVASVAVGQSVSGTGIAGGSLVQQKTDNIPTTGTTRIIINYQFTLNIPLNTSITFSAAAAALPGQTIFSLIAAPGGTSALDLSKLNELTNTPIGGRGTFPNGPDVLAINAYVSGGTGYNASINLRWGEAQA
jgi:hypothetical protein